jgi:hypothetical protein
VVDKRQSTHSLKSRVRRACKTERDQYVKVNGGSAQDFGNIFKMAHELEYSGTDNFGLGWSRKTFPFQPNLCATMNLRSLEIATGTLIESSRMLIIKSAI